MITFKYKKEPLTNSNRGILRPIADIFIKTASNSWIEFHPYIDSGADVTMIPLSLGKLIGFHLVEKNVRQIGGIKGSVPVVFTKAVVKIGVDILPVSIAWALIEEVPPLLGRKDVFDRYNILFKQSKQEIIFEKTHTTKES